MIAAIVAAAVAIVIANEACDLAPWCACKIARWSAFRQYADPARAAVRAEERQAIINERPGNILKLATALSFAAGGVIVSGRSVPEADEPHSEVLARVYTYLDGDMDEPGYAEIRAHLDECGPCLREYGLEEAVKRLVTKCCGAEGPPNELRVKVMTRIQAVRAELDTAEFRVD
jgi:mycothiol system anti-sigma-R factor